MLFCAAVKTSLFEARSRGFNHEHQTSSAAPTELLTQRVRRQALQTVMGNGIRGHLK
jgi:hypothetical protein